MKIEQLAESIIEDLRHQLAHELPQLQPQIFNLSFSASRDIAWIDLTIGEYLLEFYLNKHSIELTSALSLGLADPIFFERLRAETISLLTTGAHVGDSSQ